MKGQYTAWLRVQLNPETMQDEIVVGADGCPKLVGIRPVPESFGEGYVPVMVRFKQISRKKMDKWEADHDAAVGDD